MEPVEEESRAVAAFRFSLIVREMIGTLGVSNGDKAWTVLLRCHEQRLRYPKGSGLMIMVSPLSQTAFVLLKSGEFLQDTPI